MNLRLIDFVCTALLYAQRQQRSDAGRLFDSPYSGVPRADARAFAAVGGERESLGEMIAAKRVGMTSDSAYAAARFAHGLDRIAELAALPSETAATLIETIVAAFDLRALDGEGERETIDAIVAEARACDEGGTCTPASLATRIRQTLRTAPQVHAPVGNPLRALERQPRRPVRRRTQHFSASSLEMYADCPRKWFYRYTCATVDDPGSPASFYGTAFHWALEQFHGEIVRVDPDTPRAPLLTKLTAWINAGFELYRSGFGSAVEYELHRRRACRTAVRYIDWLCERARLHPFTVAGNEVEIALDLQDLKFVGFIDRIDRDERSGALTVLDYKTGKIAEYASTYRQEIASFIEFQLPFYYWSQSAAGERVSKLALVPLRDGYGEIEPVELEVVPVSAPSNKRDRSTRGVIGIDELERARAKMIEIASTLAAERIERFATAPSPDSCEYCVYRHACRERPAPGAPRFSR